jgi:hypothetical protein
LRDSIEEFAAIDIGNAKVIPVAEIAPGSLSLPGVFFMQE